MSKKILVLGPSHVKRLAHAYDYGILPDTKLNIKFFGHDGMPIWHPAFTKILKSADYDQLLVIVGDFRFGNKIFAQTEAKKASGVAKELINYSNDQKLYEKSIAVIQEWITFYGDKIKFIFWDLLGREFANRQNNYYVIDGHYCHPTWNYDDVAERFKHHIIDIGFLKNEYMNRLTVDSANHFSFYAYLLLTDILKNTDNIIHVKKEVVEYKANIIDLKINTLPIDKLVLICDPPLYQRLSTVIAKGALPQHQQVTLLTVQQFITQPVAFAPSKVLYLSSFRWIDHTDINENEAKYQKFVRTLNKIKKIEPQFKIILHDYLCDYVFELRKKYENKTHNLPDKNSPYSFWSLQIRHSNIIDYDIDDFYFFNSLFELSGHLPNFKGYLFILLSASIGQFSVQQFNFFYDYFICDVFKSVMKNDV